MKTLRLPIDTTLLDDLRRVQSAVIRSSYEIARNQKLTPRQIELLLITRFPNIDGDIFRSGCKKGWDINEARNATGNNTPILFGSVENFSKKAKNKITKDEWRRCRLQPLYSIGRANCNGNRRLRLTDTHLVYKDKNQEYRMELPNLKSNYRNILRDLIRMSNAKEIAITYSVGDGYASLVYDETKLAAWRNRFPAYKKIAGRVLGIDMNPNEIGISIYDRNTKKIIAYEALRFSNEFLLRKGNKTNKRKNEISHIAERIYELAKHYGCHRIGIEALDIKAKDHGKGRAFNRKVNNQWLRSAFVSKLVSICALSEVRLCEMNAAYSSFIGNLNYPDIPDSCAAATEVARRAAHQYEKNKFYPKLITNTALEHRWKEMAGAEYDTWVDLYVIFKNLHLGWRTQGKTGMSSRLLSRKTCVLRWGSKCLS